MEDKTNVMRVLDSKKINYKAHTYNLSAQVSGSDIARALDEDPNRVFKTLVTVSKSKKYYVFVIPVDCELDLKKAAKCVSEKSIDMLKSKDLLGITGYIHGGCSPIGMKKQFTTTFHITANDYETIMFSAGKVGYQVELSLSDVYKVINFQIADIVVE